jgi:flavin-dependent dehydrogenase
MLLQRAEAAGAEIEKTRVIDIQRRQAGWILKTTSGTLDADYCIIATGARNALRDVGTKWCAADTMTALGYYIPAEQDHIDIQFFSGFEGYIWIFPRNNHLSAGICGKGEPAQALRARLEKYLAEKGISLKGSTFYGHVLPSLEKPAWRSNRVAGEGWMAVGDAAGLVDPVTGEGLYYAVRSADLAAKVLLSESPYLVEDYRSELRSEFTEDLEMASRLAKRVYLGKFIYADVPTRMIQFMRRSPTFNALMQDLFAGTQNYLDLKTRLIHGLNGTLREVLMSHYFKRLVPNPP